MERQEEVAVKTTDENDTISSMTMVEHIKPKVTPRRLRNKRQISEKEVQQAILY